MNPFYMPSSSHKSKSSKTLKKPQEKKSSSHKGRDKKMSGTAEDPMEGVDPSGTEDKPSSDNHHERSGEHGEAAADTEGWSLITPDSLRDDPDMKQFLTDQPPPEVPAKVPGPTQQATVEATTAYIVQEPQTGPVPHAAQSEHSDVQLQLQQVLQEQARHKESIQRLESEAQRVPSMEDRTRTEEVGQMSMYEKQKYEEKIWNLKKIINDMEKTTELLLNSRQDLETRYKTAFSQLEKEKRARDEAELGLRSEIATVTGQWRKEKERAQKYMKTMAEMQSADPLKLDNNHFTTYVKELRYDIRNWAFSQRLQPSLPPQSKLTTWAGEAIGMGRDKGPNYDCFKCITPNYHEYTGHHQDFKYLLQAYVWKRLIEMIYEDGMWAGTRKQIPEEDGEYKMILGHYHLKCRLEPDENSTLEYRTEYHLWLSTTARILDKRIGAERRKCTVEMIRKEIITPLLEATEPHEQEISNVEDLDSIIENTMQLASSMAQQRANFAFEFMALTAYGNQPFNPAMMTDPFPTEPFDSRTHFRAVILTLAPRLLKWGTSEGTNFDTCVQLMEAEMETKPMPKKYAKRLA